MPLKREESSIFFLPPTVLKQADVDAKTLQDAIPKIKALLSYLNLHDQDHLEACFSRVVRLMQYVVFLHHAKPQAANSWPRSMMFGSRPPWPISHFVSPLQGKSLNIMHQGARLAAAEHMGTANLSEPRIKPASTRPGKGLAAGEASGRTAVKIEKARKDAERLSNGEVLQRLQDVFIGYSSKPRLVAVGR